jgi:uncharacterized protein (DUF58 family)
MHYSSLLGPLIGLFVGIVFGFLLLGLLFGLLLGLGLGILVGIPLGLCLGLVLWFLLGFLVGLLGSLFRGSFDLHQLDRTFKSTREHLIEKKVTPTKISTFVCVDRETHSSCAGSIAPAKYVFLVFWIVDSRM